VTLTYLLTYLFRLSFPVGHSSIKPIVNHYYNRIPRDQDGQKLEEALKNAQVLPTSRMNKNGALGCSV